jgi:hypothetical protein
MKIEAPMGVSEWINHGRKYGYYDYLISRQELDAQELAVKNAVIIGDLQQEITLLKSKEKHETKRH